MVLGGCQVTPAPVCTPQHGASQCLDKQNLLHRGWHVLLRPLKSRKLPLQHRQALGIFCWIIFFFPGYPSQLFCAFRDFCSSLGGPCRLVWWSDQLIDQLSDLGAELTPCSSPAPGFWTVIKVDVTYSRASEDWTEGRGGGASLFRPSRSQMNKNLTTLRPHWPSVCVTHRGGLFPSEASQRAVSMLRCVCVCCGEAGWWRGGAIQKYSFSGIGVEARELWKAKLFPKTSHS